MATHVCPNQGLYVDEGRDCIGIKVGTCLGFGPGGELVYTCGEEPEPGPCRKTWADSTEDYLVGGRGGGAANLVGWGSPQAIDYAISNNFDFIESHAFALIDGVAAWSPADKDTALDYITTNPGTTVLNGRSSNEWIGFTSDPGTPANVTGRNSKSPAVEREPDGGYHGYGLPQFSMMLATDALNRINGRTLVILDTASGETPTTAADVNACIQAVNRACAQEWAMITVSPESMELCEGIEAAGILSCVAINRKSGFTPAQVQAAGAAWVRVDASRNPNDTNNWIASGLRTLVRTNSRHYETHNNQERGAAGVIANDPVYARDEFAGNNYLSFYSKGTQMGTLDYWSDQGSIVNAMGYSRNSIAGLYVYNASWISDDVTVTSLIQPVLLGSLRPENIDSPQSYTLEFDMRAEWNTQPNSSLARMGIIFGCVQDTDMSGISTGSIYGNRYPPMRTGYIAYHGVGTTDEGFMAIGRFDGTDYTELVDSGTERNYPEDEWMHYTLTVTPTGILWERDGGDSVQVDDATYRGKYLFAATWNSQENVGTWVTGFKNFDLTYAEAAMGSNPEQGTLAVLSGGSIGPIDPESGERLGKRLSEPPGE